METSSPVNIVRLQSHLDDTLSELTHANLHHHTIIKSLEVHQSIHRELETKIQLGIAEDVLASYRQYPQQKEDLDLAHAESTRIGQAWLGHETSAEEAIGYVRCVKFTLESQLKEIVQNV